MLMSENLLYENNNPSEWNACLKLIVEFEKHDEKFNFC